jgi:hypothetical protein
MAEGKIKLFLSYAWADGQPFVLQLHTDLKARGFEPWMDSENMPNRGRPLPQEVITELTQCDRVIAVIGPGSLVSEACNAERAFAFSVGKIVTAILRFGEYSTVPAEVAGDFVPDFREARPYDKALTELLRVLAEPAVEPAPLFDVPALPPHLQLRPVELLALRSALRSKALNPLAARGESLDA